MKHINTHIIGVPEGEGEEKVTKIIWWLYSWKLSKSEEENRYLGIESTYSSKQDESKEAYIKTYHN